MTFITISIDREQLSLLSQFLVAQFPGCTIHQSCDPIRVMKYLSDQKVDAVFADTDTIVYMTDWLTRHKINTSVWILCRQDEVLPKEIPDCYGILSYPISKEKIRFL